MPSCLLRRSANYAATCASMMFLPNSVRIKRLSSHFAVRSVRLCCPSGAEARLEAMLDTLAEVEVPDVSDERDAGGAKRRIFKIPRLVWHGAAAVALLAVGYIFMDENVQSHEKQQTVVAEFAEEDTFDNPEDAMECFKGAFENMMLVVNTTHKNTRKMENNLNKAVAPYKNMIKINIQ